MTNTIRFYQYNAGAIVCEDCYEKDLRQTLIGNLVGDEAVYSKDVRALADWRTEPYQCDGCLVQNEAYEDMGNSDLD